MVCRGEVALNDAQLAHLLQTQFGGYVHADAVHDLQRSMLIERADPAQVHALIREPVLNALKLRPEDWQACHRVAARWAEHQGDSIAAAHHWQQAGDVSQACQAITQPNNGPINANFSRLTEAVGVIDTLLASLTADIAHKTPHTPHQDPAQHQALLCSLHITCYRGPR